MQQVSPKYPNSKRGTPAEPSPHAKAFDFTNTSVDAVTPPEAGRVEYRDARNPALILRVTASGTKSFCVGRKVGGRFVRVTLGTFKRAGDTLPRMTVDRAVVALRKVDGALAEGADVNAEKRAKRTRGRTLGDWLKDYLASNTKLKPNTRSDYQRAIGEMCSDWLDLPMADLTREKIKARHKRHGAERSEARANNAVRVLRALFNFAGIVPNPAANPKKKGADGAFLFDDKRKRTLIRPHQMPAWWAAVSGLSGRRVDSGHALASDLLRTLLLTGMRAGEACRLEWQHTDADAGFIVIPDTKNGVDHELPVGDLLLGILKRRHDERTGPYVFGSKSDSEMPYSYDTLRSWLGIIAAESGVKVTAHDLRRTFATIADSLDIAGATVKQLLNHRTGRSDVTEGYIVRSPERLRGAMQRIEDEVLRLASASTPA
jgi:integrase